MKTAPDYSAMINSLLHEHEIKIEQISLDTDIAVATLYRIKRGQTPRALAAQKRIVEYYARISGDAAHP
jgi:predicted transcriptional regulator